jgi:vancomycin resistance protein YoaR
MAQPSTTHDGVQAVAGRFDIAESPLGRFAAATFGRLRQSVLPHDEEPRLEGREGRQSVRSRTFAQRAVRATPLVLVAASVLVLLVAVGMFGFRTWYADRIYPAVIVGDVPVGGLTVAEAETVLAARAAALETGTIAFTYGDRTWTPTLAELGVTVDLAGSLAAAEALGREGDAATRLATARELLQDDQVVPLRTTLDTGVLAAWFDAVDRDLGQPAVDARVVVDGTQVTISPEAAGLAVDRAAATAQVVAALEGLAPVTVALPTAVAAPAITTADLVAVQATVQQAMSRPIRVTFEDKTWRIDGPQLIPYLTIENVLRDGEPVVDLAFDTTRLAEALRAQFADAVNRQPVNAQVTWDNAVGLVALEPSVDGITVNGGAFARAVANGFLGGDDSIEVPVVVIHPDIDSDNIDALGIETLLGQGDSNFVGGTWARDENIYVGTRLLNGTLVRPGAEFSFNGAIGEITAEKGYQEALVVVAEQVGRGVGGGVCQISTTVFRAAILAGMPITEWHAHTYRLPGYELDGWGPGFDASILQSGSNPENWADFRFENYTDGWLYVEAYTYDMRVYVNIYGTDTGRTVDVDAWGIDGKSTGFTRTIYDANGGVVAERDFPTRFK